MHLENLFFIVLALAFVVLRWLAQRAGDSKKAPDEREPTTPAPAQSDEERMRRFMEALGNPVGSKPPPKVTPRPVQQAREAVADAARKAQEKVRSKTVFSPLPPLTTAPPMPPTIAQPESRPSATAVAEPKRARTLAPAAFAPQREETQMPAQPDLAALLRSAESLRNAIVVREILGAPRALQPLHEFPV